MAAPAQNAAANPSVRATGACAPVANASIRIRNGDRREDRDPHRAADLLRRVDETRGETRLVRLRARDGSDRDRHVGERHPEADDQEPGKRSLQYEPSGDTCVK